MPSLRGDVVFIFHTPTKSPTISTLPQQNTVPAWSIICVSLMIQVAALTGTAVLCWCGMTLLMGPPGPMPSVMAFAVRQNSSGMTMLPPGTRSSRISVTGTALSASPPPMTVNELFASDGWEPICADLDQLPIFTVANEKGQPMAYEVIRKGETLRVPFFYTDIDDALNELKSARETIQLPGMDLIPYPLGKAFVLWASDQAVIVPNRQAILEAGAPPYASPVGQSVPLFACMDIAQETPEGKSVLPLFLERQDAQDAVAEAVLTDGGSLDEFEIVSLSLNRAVEILATNPESTAFHFIPPASSMRYIEEYLSG